MAPTGEEASEWKMKHTQIFKKKNKTEKKKLKPLLPNVSGKKSNRKQKVEGLGR